MLPTCKESLQVGLHFARMVYSPMHLETQGYIALGVVQIGHYPNLIQSSKHGLSIDGCSKCAYDSGAVVCNNPNGLVQFAGKSCTTIVYACSW
jgi:hypothetical protein